MLDAWRQADRDLEEGRSELGDDVAHTVARSLRDIYQYVSGEKTAAARADDGAEQEGDRA